MCKYATFGCGLTESSGDIYTNIFILFNTFTKKINIVFTLYKPVINYNCFKYLKKIFYYLTASRIENYQFLYK